MEKYKNIKYVSLIALGMIISFNTAYAASGIDDKPNAVRPYTEFENNFGKQLSATAEINAKKTEVFQKNLLKIKDTAKKDTINSINDRIQSLNKEITNAYRLTYIVMSQTVSNIESRMNKSQTSGVDVSSVTPSLEKAKASLTDLSGAILKQASNTYTINITDVSSLKSQTKSVRNTLEKDLNILKDKTKITNDSLQELEKSIFKILGKETTNTKVESTNTTIKK